MASIRTTINKTTMGNKRVHFGKALYVNGQTESEIQVDLRKLEAFIIPQLVWEVSFADGLVTFKHTDPGAAATGGTGWMAIGY